MQKFVTIMSEKLLPVSPAKQALHLPRGWLAGFCGPSKRGKKKKDDTSKHLYSRAEYCYVLTSPLKVGDIVELENV